MEAFLQMIPQRFASREFLLSPRAFVRHSKLPLPSLVVFLLFLVGGGKIGRASCRERV